MQIELENLQKKIPLNLRKIRKAIEKILKAEKRLDIHLTVSFVDDRKIKELNFRYRKVDSPTDVLSFDYSQSMGEIIISPQTINRNAKRFRTSRESEMELCLIHGILHLFGYNDQDPKSQRLMRKKEMALVHLLHPGGAGRTSGVEKRIG